MKILILRFSSMGDVILASSLLSYIKNNYPEAELFFLTNALYAELFNDDPRLSSCIPFSRNAQDTILAELSSHTWDIVIDLQNNRRSGSIRRKYFPGIKYGFFNKHHIKRLILLLLRLNLYDHEGSVGERYIQASTLALNKDSGIPPVKLFFTNEEIFTKVLRSGSGVIENPALALMPFCAWKNKQWHQSSFAEVGRYFLKKRWNVVIFGGPEDVENAEKLKADIGEGAVSLAGKMNLYQTGCFLKKCLLALGNDTGLSHLARACGVKTAVIYGATTSQFGFFPHGEPPFKVFQSRQFCRPCHPHGGNICWRLSRPCLRQIKPQEVIEGLEELLHTVS